MPTQCRAPSTGVTAVGSPAISSLTMGSMADCWRGSVTGVSIGSLYQYFPNREGLLDFAIELCVRYTTGMFQEYRPMLAAMPLKDALSAYLMGGLEWGQTATGLVRFFGRAADDQAAPTVSFNQLARLFDQCVDLALGVIKRSFFAGLLHKAKVDIAGDEFLEAIVVRTRRRAGAARASSGRPRAAPRGARGGYRRPRASARTGPPGTACS